MFLKVLLLSLLPVISLLIFITGQNYNHELIDFQATPEQQISLARYLPETSGFYSRKGATRRYTREDLYEHINGHAELFISSGFKQMVVANYLQKNTSKEIVIDIYDTGNSKKAYRNQYSPT